MNLQDLDYKNILYSPVFSKILVTLIILLVGMVIGRVIGKVIYRVLHELNLNQTIRKTTKIKASIEKVISSFIAYFIYFVTIIMALSNLGLSTTVLNIIIIAIVTVFIIAIFFIIKDFFPNILAGIFIKQKGFIKEGDFIAVEGKEGKIISINIIETTIKTEKGDVVYIPNAILSQKEITKLAR